MASNPFNKALVLSKNTKKSMDTFNTLKRILVFLPVTILHHREDHEKDSLNQSRTAD
jgi:glycopeptide antibiotics resistance protein